MKSMNKILTAVVVLLISLGLLAAVYYLGYVGIEKTFKKKNTVYNDFFSVDGRLANFGDFKATMEDKKEDILTSIYLYQDFLYSNAQNTSTYQEKVVKILKSMGISIKEKTKSGLVGNAAIKEKTKGGTLNLTLNMTATYPQICQFLFEIERFSVVSNIKMDYKGNVELNCSPVQFSKEIDDHFNDKQTAKKGKKDSLDSVKYFEDIFEKTLKVKREIGTVMTWEDFKPLPRSPFYRYVVAKKAVKSTGGGGHGRPDIEVSGIMYDADDPIVIIGDKFYHVGSVYKNAKIVKINPSNIQVRYYGKVYTIRMKY